MTSIRLAVLLIFGLLPAQTDVKPSTAVPQAQSQTKSTKPTPRSRSEVSEDPALTQKRSVAITSRWPASATFLVRFAQMHCRGSGKSS